MNLTVILVSSSQSGEAQKAVLRRTELKKSNCNPDSSLPHLILHPFLSLPSPSHWNGEFGRETQKGYSSAQC